MRPTSDTATVRLSSDRPTLTRPPVRVRARAGTLLEVAKRRASAAAERAPMIACAALSEISAEISRRAAAGAASGWPPRAAPEGFVVI